jgi:DNA-binding XRE family transcriptional regulator
MDRHEFFHIRKQLNKTQKQMAEILGASIKAIHSYEQGWRTIPLYVERQLFFLLSRVRKQNGAIKDCWKIKKCPSSRKKRCPAWEFKSGKLCWFINGTICEGTVQKSWQEKIKTCRSCEVWASLLGAVS